MENEMNSCCCVVCEWGGRKGRDLKKRKQSTFIATAFDFELCWLKFLLRVVWVMASPCFSCFWVLRPRAWRNLHSTSAAYLGSMPSHYGSYLFFYFLFSKMGWKLTILHKCWQKTIICRGGVSTVHIGSVSVQNFSRINYDINV